MSKINEIVCEALEEQLVAIRFNLSNVLGGLLYSVKLELEEKGIVGGIDDLIRIIVDTSSYPDHEESYPEWAIDERFPSNKQKANLKRAKEVLEALTEILKEHGITQSWNFGQTYED